MPKKIEVKPTFDGKLMFPSDYLTSVEFQGQDVTLTIRDIKPESLRTNDGDQEDGWVMTFVETKKRMGLNKTNARAIAALYGRDLRNAIGKRITLYPTTCSLFGATVDCIRVRPKAPGAGPNGKPKAKMTVAQARGELFPEDDQPETKGGRASVHQ